jgi:hypothetical protein
MYFIKKNAVFYGASKGKKITYFSSIIEGGRIDECWERPGFLQYLTKKARPKSCLFI